MSPLCQGPSFVLRAAVALAGLVLLPDPGPAAGPAGLLLLPAAAGVEWNNK